VVEHSSDFEWRGEGEAAEVVIYAPDAPTAGSAFERALPAARLPGVVSPVYAAAGPDGFGWAAASASHASPEACSVPARGMLLVADAGLEDLGLPPLEVPRLLARNLSEVRPPALTAAGARRLCEAGARAAAEDGLIEEEDLAFLGPVSGADADALTRRALSAGSRDWDLPGEIRAYAVTEVLDSEGAESVGLGAGAFVVAVSVGAGDLGRLALSGHRERMVGRGEDFEREGELPAAPAGSEEADDFLAAAGAAANFADARAALLAYALRRALGDVAGNLSLRAAWRLGGIEVEGGLFLHRRDLAAAAGGDALVSGGSVVAGTGKMCGSVPYFDDPEVGGERPWEEAGLLERWAELHPPEGKS
jgi:tRNA-splicing ligase RtcB